MVKQAYNPATQAPSVSSQGIVILPFMLVKKKKPQNKSVGVSLHGVCCQALDVSASGGSTSSFKV